MLAKNLILFVLIFSFFSSFGAAKGLVDKAVVVINSEPILQSELQTLISRTKKEGGIDELLLFEDSLSKLKSDRKMQIDFLIKEKLIESEIKRLGLGISDERVNSEMNQMAARNRMPREQLELLIKKQGYTIEDYRKLLKARLERQSFFESEIIGKLRITDEDAYSEYRATSPNFKENMSSFKVAQIFFSPKRGGVEAAQERAIEIRRRLDAGDSFESLAKKFNEDPGAEENGYLGEFKTGEFVPELEKSISQLSAGESTKIIRTKQGFHILKLLEKTATQDPQFIKTKEQIRSRLVEKNFRRQLKNWIESKKQDSNIQIY
jgi:peptidyl-prolyl cis-trans isomerase SurA